MRNPHSPAGPRDVDGHLPIDAGRKADELLKREAIEPSATEIRGAWLVNAQAAREKDLACPVHAIENCAGELLLERRYGINRVVHGDECRIPLARCVTVFSLGGAEGSQPASGMGPMCTS